MQEGEEGIEKLVQDRFTRGLFDGLIAGLIKLVFSQVFFVAGLARWTEIQRGAAIFWDSWAVHPAVLWLIGLSAHFSFSTLYGLLYSGLLSLTGDDYALLKGFAVGLIGWLAAGILTRVMGIQSVFPKDMGAEVIWLLSHLVYGCSLAAADAYMKRRLRPALSGR